LEVIRGSFLFVSDQSAPIYSRLLYVQTFLCEEGCRIYEKIFQCDQGGLERGQGLILFPFSTLSPCINADGVGDVCEAVACEEGGEVGADFGGDLRAFEDGRGGHLDERGAVADFSIRIFCIEHAATSDNR